MSTSNGGVPVKHFLKGPVYNVSMLSGDVMQKFKGNLPVVLN